ncbi:250L [Invertebrate iridescent virus Kaz2018]|uniref:Uncharacterized protein 250L n=1 Tax=Invertebrate iridescent virus 6 TaxID=176652 RepID=250L_IIV6|nr:250L [Invertebrate iridescent virus 6]Q91FS2.1 RecName: Full=Uncharacterized protein 250L [Invertebrate iridescent virus 6]AAK82111.1 250L [Invertebrate iridescent virus 6]QMS79687.1 hypothetical protein IIV6-T1_245 [Invertebrate iridescent virus 6]QNH08660.1 250L [Invertebrate iridescent virus Kaz2018]
MNTEKVIFNYRLKFHPKYLDSNFTSYIKNVAKEIIFKKETFYVLKIEDVEILNVIIGRGQSDHIANLKITTQSIVPQENKIFSGIVTNVFPHLKLTIVTIEGKVEVIVKGETTKQINDFALVLINVVKFHNEKIVCSGSFQ